MEQLRDTVIEVDLQKLKRNVRLIREMIGNDVAIMAVIKANGYGHGALEISKVLMDSGVDYLSVATLAEALDIRYKYAEYPVLIMGHTPDKYLEYAVINNITLTIFSYKQAKLIDNLAERNNCICKVHIKIDTGFHRLGMNPKAKEDVIDEIEQICSLKHINCEGIFSHLALVNYEENEKQVDIFKWVNEEIANRGIDFKYKHIADSIATVDYPQYRMNMVRVGALIYGMKGFQIGNIDVEQILTFKTAISQIHHIKSGEGVGYDYLWRAERDSVIATLPFGYADGYPRNMSGKGYVTIKGKKCPLIGVLCMDQVMVDVTDVKNVDEGEIAIIYGSGQNEMTIQEAAILSGTNKNDIISRLTNRSYREYKY